VNKSRQQSTITIWIQNSSRNSIWKR